ncbi:SYNPR-AS1 isoform 2 [Pan troglodytes]|uniref:SYNPR-AS1 isoform 2 n=1 Tax=Pan troglodytes TaxID=9598 RepID=A0A2J8P7E8_PANTR|nr:SYNPR-AS1 isoform 2 [Pan troglodytes]
MADELSKAMHTPISQSRDLDLFPLFASLSALRQCSLFIDRHNSLKKPNGLDAKSNFVTPYQRKSRLVRNWCRPKEALTEPRLQVIQPRHV